MPETKETNRRRRWAIIAAVFISAFRPRFVDLDNLPADPSAGRYRAEALRTLGWVRDNPFQQVFDRLFLQHWRFSNWREVPGSGEDSTSLPHLMDVWVDAAAIGPWGIPYARYTIGCGGACTQVPRRP
ncbi:hypothetical protein [Qipengyuania sp. NPDC077563]|uniref:hypothetical protein n=1 Tax=Qipengyuania sp. NPDC077563 TaxID=3364497 RepID=UPI00384DEDB7